MVSLSTFCFMLALAWIYTHRTSFNRKFTNTHTVWPTTSADAFILTRSRCDVLCGLRGADPIPLIDLQNLRRLITMVPYDGSHHPTILPSHLDRIIIRLSDQTLSPLVYVGNSFAKKKKKKINTMTLKMFVYRLTIRETISRASRRKRQLCNNNDARYCLLYAT